MAYFRGECGAICAILYIELRYFICNFINNRRALHLYNMSISFTVLPFLDFAVFTTNFDENCWSLINLFQRHSRNPPRFKTSVALFIDREYNWRLLFSCLIYNQNVVPSAHSQYHLRHITTKQLANSFNRKNSYSVKWLIPELVSLQFARSTNTIHGDITRSLTSQWAKNIVF